jgi:hypothetical protein
MQHLHLKPQWLLASLAAALLTIPAWAGASPTHYSANLSALNSSGVTGTANLTLNGDMLKVHITASGLKAGMVHPQHIHGVLSDGTSGHPVQSTTPTIAVDDPSNGGNGDGVIELGEGQTTYGPILVPLTSPPGGALSDFPTAPDGSIDFTQMYDLSSSGIYNDGYDESDVLPLSLREIVIHGMDAPIDLMDGGDSYSKGDYDPVLPIASGVISATAVPGPSSILMILTGFGLLLGFLGFRRKQP